MKPDDGPKPTANRPRDKVATAEYISDLCKDLARMARGERFDTLAYLLDMACLEAETVGQRAKPPSTKIVG